MQCLALTLAWHSYVVAANKVNLLRVYESEIERERGGFGLKACSQCFRVPFVQHKVPNGIYHFIYIFFYQLIYIFAVLLEILEYNVTA